MNTGVLHFNDNKVLIIRVVVHTDPNGSVVLSKLDRIREQVEENLSETKVRYCYTLTRDSLEKGCTVMGHQGGRHFWCQCCKKHLSASYLEGG